MEATMVDEPSSAEGKREPAKFEKFMDGFFAAYQLLERARDKKALIELVVLAAAVIDGFLRVGLVLAHQLKTRSDDIPDELIHQADDERGITERGIFKRALDEGVIDERMFNILETLYRLRNRVVHRYIISEITTHDVLKVAAYYERLIPAVGSYINVLALEDRQIKEGVGITEDGTPEKHRALMHDMEQKVRAKHGAPWLANFLKRDTPNEKES
jgi:hypothetical protein